MQQKLAGIEFFIEKLANSGNPVLAGLAQEMQSQLPPPVIGASSPVVGAQSPTLPILDANAGVAQQGTDENEEQSGVDQSLAVGDQSFNKPKDTIDTLLMGQMPELETDKESPSNQSVSKVATWRDVILARRKK